MSSFENEYMVSPLTNNDVNDVFEIENSLLGTSSISSISSTLTSDTLFYFTLKKGNEVVGFMEISIIAPECELYDIAIKLDYQGLKLSKLLMDYLFSLCKEKNCETIFLEVNSINSKAINLYKQYGFKEYLVRKNYYGKNDAILMKVEI